MKIHEQALEKFYVWISTSGLKIVIGLFLIWIGFKIITRVIHGINNVMEKRNVDVTLASFLDTFMNICFKILLILIVMNYVGISTNGLVALLGSAGIAVGLSLKESLTNFAGSVILLFIRPFNEGDYIEGAGESGRVDKIGIYYTHMSTVDNKQIVIPNGSLANSIVRNYTAQEMRRVDLTFCVGYDQDIKTVKDAIFDVINKDARILNEPKPFVAVSELAESTVNFITRVWTKTDDYWTVYYSLLENVKIKFDEENIVIPYPQMNIHVNNIEEKTVI